MALIGKDNHDEDVNIVRLKAAMARLNEIYTPSSPSPPREFLRNQSPILIPSDKVKNNGIEKPDIYRCAAESLANKRSPVDIVSPQIDISKPPLSKEDLLLLNEPEKEDSFDEASLLTINELENLRATIKMELGNTHEKKQTVSDWSKEKLDKDKTSKSNLIKIPDKEIKTTKDNHTKTKEQDIICKLSQKFVPSSVTVVKQQNTFGDVLESIDKKFIKDDNKKKDKKVDESKPKPIEKKPLKSNSDLDIKDHRLHKSNIIEVVVSGDIKVQESVKLPEQQEVTSGMPFLPVYKRLADKYNPKPRKISTDRIDQSPIHDARNVTDIRSPVESSTGVKSSFELPCDKANTVSGFPSNQSKMPSLLGNQYIPNPNAMLPNKPLNYTNQNPFSSPPQNQFITHQTQYSSPQQNHYLTQQNPYAVPQLNQFNTPIQNMMVPAMVPSQNAMMPMVSPQSMTQHNSGGNTYMNTYILQANVSSNEAHGYFNNMVQNAFHNQMGSSKSFHPFQPIENKEGDYYQSSNYSVYPQNSYANRSAIEARKAVVSRDPRDRSYDRQDNYRQDVKSSLARDPRMRNTVTTSKEVVRRSSVDTPQNKYDTLYANIDKDSEKFVSPLDSLYSTTHKTGKGYGMQKFKIPRKNDKQPSQTKRYDRDRFKNDQSKEHQTNESEHLHKHNHNEDENDEVLSKDRSKSKQTKLSSLSPSPPHVADTSKYDKTSNSRIQVQEISESTIQNTQKEENEECKEREMSKKSKTAGVPKTGELSKDKTAPKNKIESSPRIDSSVPESSSDVILLSSSTETLDPASRGGETCSDTKEVSTTQPEIKAEDAKATPNEEEIIGTYLASLFQKSNKEELLSVILSSLAGGTLEQQRKKFRRIQKIVESDSDNGDDNETKKVIQTSETESQKTEPIETEPQETKLLKTEELLLPLITEEISKGLITSPEPKKILKKKVARRRRFAAFRRKKKFTKNSSAPQTTSSIEQAEQVIESVGERIKNRRRQLEKGKCRKKCRTELDMLHDDIREMFISGGILTANGKRMCRILKSGDSDQTKSSHSRSTEEDSTSTLLDSPRRCARSTNPKVVIEKTDLTKLVPVSGNSTIEKSDTESDLPISKKKRMLRPKRAYLDSSSESSINSPIRKFPKRVIKNKPNYYEDPNDIGVPKQPEPEQPPILHVDSPTRKKSTSVKQIGSDMEVPTEVTPPTQPLKKRKKVKKIPLIPKMTIAKPLLNKKLSKKKKPGWSLGIIKKKKRLSVLNTSVSSVPDDDNFSQISNVELLEEPTPLLPPTTSPPPPPIVSSNDNDCVLIEPDRTYYFDPQKKSACKICAFKGRFIVQHYRSSHPKSEVLISRIAPEETKKAIKESVDHGYDSIEIPQLEESKFRKKRFTYQCRFCHSFFKNETSETFFDHLTSHTGEYRFPCSLCQFKTSNSKSLRSHYHSSHTASFEQTRIIFPTYEAAPSYHMVFGYACSECYFIQLDQDAIKDHMKIYHLGDNNQMFRINMSMIVTKQSTESFETKQEIPNDINKIISSAANTDEDYNRLINVVANIDNNSNKMITSLSDTVKEDNRIDTSLTNTDKSSNEFVTSSALADKYSNITLATNTGESNKIITADANTDKDNKQIITSATNIHKDNLTSLKLLPESNKTKEFDEPVNNMEPNETEESTIVSSAEAIGKKIKNTSPKQKVLAKPKLKQSNKRINNVPISASSETLTPEITPIVTTTEVSALPTAVEPVIENLVIFQENTDTENDLKPNPCIIEDSPVLLSKKFSFNLLDKIKIRLEDIKLEDNRLEETRQTNHEDDNSNNTGMVNIQSKTVTDLDKPSSYNQIEFKIPQSPPLRRLSSSNETSPLQKGHSIECSQGNLKVDVTQKPLDGTIILAKTEDVVIEVGPITATKGSSFVLYSCNINSCTFSSTIPHEFSVHCTNLHDGYQWKRFCKICDTELQYCGFEAIDAYNHLIDIHLSDDCKFTPDSFLMHNITDCKQPDEPLIVMNSDSDFTFKIVSVGTVEEPPAQPVDPYEIPFLLSDYRTLPFDMDEAESSNYATLKPLGSSPAVVNLANMTRVPSPGTSASPTFHTTMLVPTSKSPPLLTPLTKTSRLALVPVNKTPPAALKVPESYKPAATSILKSKRITLRDTPLHGEELLRDRKSKEALAVILTEENLVHLYKCPEFNCIYTTDSKRSFEAHLIRHTNMSHNTEIPCLYCNYKTEFGNIAIHYDVRHAKCTFCCVYCLYRAINQSYVEIHQELKHSGMPRRVLMVPLNPDASSSQANIAILPLRDVVRPYLCGCKKKFVFGIDLLKHAKAEHSGIITCGYCLLALLHLESTITHMQAHNVYNFHCRYCSFGSTNKDDILKHLSLHHFANEPRIVSRRFVPKVGNPKTSSDYDYEDDELFDCLKIITHYQFNYYTPSAKKIINQTGSKASNLKALENTIDSTQPTMRSNSPMVVNKLSTSRNVSLSILEPNSSPNSASTNIVNNKQSEEIHLADPNITTTIATSLLNNTSTIQKGKELALPDCDTARCIDGNDDNIENLNITPPESDISMDNSLSDVMDLTLSDSGETHFSDLTAEESSFTAPNTKTIGLTGRDLFKCGFCKVGFDFPQDFKSHVITCIEMNISNSLKPYKCAHCVKAFKSMNNVLDHIRVHGTDRFACSLCDYKAQHHIIGRQHMKTKHKITSVTVMPIDRHKRNYDCDEFIIRPKSTRHRSFEITNKDTTVINEPKKAEKLMYLPDEIDVLPVRPIFPDNRGCALCGYLTKVKANLLRHLHLHKDAAIPVPTFAPINPVPCLENNEKMFDKMTNLSHSGYNSNPSRMSSKMGKNEPFNELTKEEQDRIPLFIPSTKRNVCGATGCDYLCLDDHMFKCHLQALHGTEKFYRCNHCEAVLSSGEVPINVDVIIKHQKLHDLKLYKCKYCPYLYNVKHKVEHHITEVHSGKKVGVIVIREMAREPIDTSNYEREREWEEFKEPKPWRCGMCKYRCAHKQEIVAHILNKHELDEGQYKCALCTYKSNAMDDFPSHFETEHSAQTLDVIDVYYKVENKAAGNIAFDTTPIWKLNRNSNYIRGIPIEESKMPKKSPVKSTISDNLVRSIELVASGGSPSSKTKSPKEKMTEVKERRKSIAVTKNLKALKEKPTEQNEIIEIEDDIDPIVDGELTIEKIQQMDPDKLIESNLSGKYGYYGKPYLAKYFCPYCKQFKTSVEQDITNHLYKDLDYFRYICTICRLYGVTRSFLQNHSKSKHPEKPESIIMLSPDNNKEDWVAMVIAVQKRIIEGSNSSLKSGNEKSSTAHPSPAALEAVSSNTNTEIENTNKSNKYQCEHCQYSTKHRGDIVKHEKRHWLQKPFKCGYCDIEGVAKPEIMAHHKRSHPGQEPFIVTRPAPNSPTIQPIRKRKRLPPLPLNVTPIDDSIVDTNSIQNVKDSPTEIEDKTVYVCNYCRKRLYALDEMKTHVQNLHTTKDPKSSYKTTLSSKLPKKHSINYKCFHCDFISNVEAMKNHFKMDHPAQNVSLYRYQCSYCNEYFRKLEKIKAHCKQVHGDENPENIDIKVANNPSLTKEFVCELCNLQCDKEQDLSEHYKMLHPHLEPSPIKDNENSYSNIAASVSTPVLETIEEQKLYKCPECGHSSNSSPSICDHLRIHCKPYKCNYCELSFTYPSLVKAHTSKEHSYFPIKYITVEESMKKFENLKKALLLLKDGKYIHIGEKKRQKRPKEMPLKEPLKKVKPDPTMKPTARKSTTNSIIMRKTARKSTTQIIPTIVLDDADEDEGFSYYGTQADVEGIENVKTSLTLMDKML